MELRFLALSGPKFKFDNNTTENEYLKIFMRVCLSVFPQNGHIETPQKTQTQNSLSINTLKCFFPLSKLNYTFSQ